jgi:hypothetical protein
MARHCDQRAAETERHVLDETGFATPRGSFEHDRHAALRGSRKQLDLTAHVRVIRFLLDPVLPDVELTP